MISSLTLVTLVSVAAAPARIAAPGLEFVNVDSKLGEFYSEHLAQQLKYAGFQVITSREMASILGLERQKQLTGCTDASASCMTELANALGADGILLGDVALLSGTFQVNAKIIASRDGRTLSLASGRASSEGELLDVLTTAAKQLARDASSALGLETPVKEGIRRFSWAPAALGVVGIGAGIAFTIVTGNARSALVSGTPGRDGASLRDTGQTTGPLAVVSFVVGGAALVGALMMFLLGADSPVTASAGLGADGPVIGFVGVLP